MLVDFSIILSATIETLYMVVVSSLVATLLGLPLGFALFVFRPQGLIAHKLFYRFLNYLVNIFRSIPFIILMIFLIPFTRAIVGTSIGTTAAIIPLSLGATPLMARLSENALLDLPYGLIETGIALGASPFQIIKNILFPEIIPALINGITVISITLVGYCAMAGTIGGGGLGNLAINYGYQRFDIATMIITVVILIFLVQGLQHLGDYCYRKTIH